MGSKKPNTLGGVAYTSAGGIWEERILSLDIESIDQNLSRYFPSQMRVGVSARREMTKIGTVKYSVHIPGCQEVPIDTPHQPCVILELVKLGQQTRLIATANDRDSDMLIRLIENLENFLFPDEKLPDAEEQLQRVKREQNMRRDLSSFGFSEERIEREIEADRRNDYETKKMFEKETVNATEILAKTPRFGREILNLLAEEQVLLLLHEYARLSHLLMWLDFSHAVDYVEHRYFYLSGNLMTLEEKEDLFLILAGMGLVHSDGKDAEITPLGRAKAKTIVSALEVSTTGSQGTAVIQQHVEHNYNFYGDVVGSAIGGGNVTAQNIAGGDIVVQDTAVTNPPDTQQEIQTNTISIYENPPHPSNP